MLDFVGQSGRASERKLRLFACACARSVLAQVSDLPGRRFARDPGSSPAEGARVAVVVAERFADGLAGPEELEAASAEAAAAAHFSLKECNNIPMEQAASAAWHASEGGLGAESATSCVCCALEAIRLAGLDEAAVASGGLAALLRCVFGSPFRPVGVEPAWRTPDVVALAEAAYDERLLPSGHLDPARLSILADALEDAGCDDAKLLRHLRGPGPHTRGCFVIDLLLNRA
jgi:hypothetical protein